MYKDTTESDALAVNKLVHRKRRTKWYYDYHHVAWARKNYRNNNYFRFNLLPHRIKLMRMQCGEYKGI